MAKKKEKYPISEFTFYYEGEKKVFKIERTGELYPYGIERILTDSPINENYYIDTDFSDVAQEDGLHSWSLAYDPYSFKEEKERAGKEFLMIEFKVKSRKGKKRDLEDERYYIETLEPTAVLVYEWDDRGANSYFVKKISWTKATKAPKGYADTKQKAVCTPRKTVVKISSKLSNEKKAAMIEGERKVLDVVNQVKTFIENWAASGFTFRYKSDQRTIDFKRQLPKEHEKDTNITVYSMKEGHEIEPFHVSYLINQIKKLKNLRSKKRT